jgi:hypothetical protein
MNENWNVYFSENWENKKKENQGNNNIDEENKQIMWI